MGMLGHWIGRVLVFLLIAFLVLGFVFTGISDLLTGGRGTVVATVGGEDIYDNELAFQVRQYKEELGDSTYPPAMQKWVEKQVLDSIINKSLVRLESQRLKLDVTEDTVVHNLRDRTDVFKSGSFDPEAYQQFLRSTGHTEQTLISNIKENTLRDFLMNVVGSAAVPQKTTIELLYRYNKESRTAELLRVTDEQVMGIEDPEEEELEAYFKERSYTFSAPEYRTVSVIAFGEKDLEQRLELDDEHLQAIFEERIDDFMLPEKRDIQQIVVDSALKAKEVYEALVPAELLPGDIAVVDNKTWLSIAKEKAGRDAEAVAMGEIAAQEMGGGMLSDSIVTAVFSAEEGQVLEPRESGFGWHIYRINKIIPSQEPEFEEAKNDIRRLIIEEEGGDMLFEWGNKLDDEIASGGTLEDAAKLLDLPLLRMGPFSRAGEDQADLSIKANLPQAKDFLKTAFETEKDQTSLMVTDEEGKNYFVLRVDDVQPRRERELKEVREKVLSIWRSDQRKERLQAMAEDWAATVQNEGLSEDASSLKKLAKEHKLTTQTVSFTRDEGDVDGVPANLKKSIQGMNQPGFTTAAYSDGQGGWIIATVTGVDAAPLEGVKYELAKDKIRKHMIATMQGDVFAHYYSFLRRYHPVTIQWEPRDIVME